MFAVCRTLGIPCRSLTNFSSAHDADNTCTIDRYFDEAGNSLRNFTNDSVWNFHCWNDVWIMRPDLPPGYDGWHALDSTPQERSLGFFQCGPCPVAAVRKGDINIGYDTAFVFAEHGNQDKHKTTDRTALKNRTVFDFDDSFVRLDITEEYKPKEGSDAERRSVEKALRYTRFGEILFQGQAELKVELKEEDNKKTFVGQDVVANFVVTNITTVDRRVAVTLTARNTHYWDRGIGDDNIAKEKFGAVVLPSGQSQTFSLKIPYAEYMKGNDEWLSLFVYGCAVDLNDDMPYSAQRPYTGPAEAKSEQPVDVMVSVVNPLPDRPLTGCQFIMTGSLELADKGDKRFTSYFRMLRADVSDVKAGEKFSISFKLKGTTTVANKTKSMKFNLKSNELRDLNGDYELKLVL
ncbi:hypothetical protein C0Q70_19151 [Pomacea canaliculata]|uniref:Transglutaminase-like domain-containing protein n=1 Tax=Pomacea canaliculata TaxID=400727 RepID=A0A2T7NII5_POMCA|nr:hypothetical protein C0Q70_19151 [Pomacea canaliculata]